MPVLHLETEFADRRPLVSLCVTISSADQAALPHDSAYEPWPVRALVDTGAGQSQIDIHILTSLGAPQTGSTDLYTASSGVHPLTMPLFLVDVLVAGRQGEPLACDLEVIGSDKLGGLNVDMLLGRDVLNRCLMAYDGPNRQCSLAYDVPSPP